MKRRRQRWLFLPFLIGGLAAFTLFWYGAGENGADESQPRFGGSYVEGVAGTAARPNPLFADENSVDAGLVGLLFSGLTRLDDHGRVFPDLADRWDVSADGLTYVFHLRSGLLWHDSAAVTPDDVLFTLDLVTQSRERPPPPLVTLLAGATISQSGVDSVTIELVDANAALPAYLSMGILPSHLLGGAGLDDLYDSPFNQHPVGTGPYRLEELAGTRAVLAADPAYHFGQAYIQRFEMRFYRDEGTLMTALMAGEVDGAFFASGLAGHDLTLLEGRKDLRLDMAPGPDKTAIFLNLDEPVFEDRRLRQALYYAIDRDRIVDDVVDGQAVRADSPLPGGSWAASGTLRRYSSDPSVAAALLDDAGWRMGTGGLRVRNGLELGITLATNSDPVRAAVAEDIAVRWRALGVRTTVLTPGTTVLVRDMLEPRDFEAVLFSYRAGLDPDPYRYWHSSQAVRIGANLPSFDSPRADDLLEQGREATSEQTRLSRYLSFEELFAQELPALPLYDSVSIYARPERIERTRPGYMADPGNRFWQVQDWYLSPE